MEAVVLLDRRPCIRHLLPPDASCSASNRATSPFVPTYDFGVVRVATFALLTFTALLGSPCCGVVTAKFSGHAVIFRSSPTVFGDGWMLGSTSTRILSGKPPRATWSAAMLLGLYRMCCSSFSTDNSYGEQPTTSSPCRRAHAER